jgi:mycothiol synthase
MAASSYNIRNYRPTDFDSLVRFFQSERPAITSISQRVADWLAWPGFTPEKDIFIVESNDIIAGYMSLRPELGIDRVMIGCRLRREYRRKGLSLRLLERAMSRARELGVGVAHVDIMQDNSGARKALEKHGFRPVRQYYELELDMSIVDWEEAKRASCECRHLLPGEEAELADIQNRSFAEHWGYNPNTEETISFLINRVQSSPEDVIVICEEGGIVGFCRTEVIGNGEGRISMIGTDPDFRGKGVGRTALLAGLLHLKSRSVKTTKLTVDTGNDAALALYESVGFRHTNMLITYEKSVD